MDLSLERDSSSALGSLFQQIINDLKNTSPLWEDFVTKATKLHQCLRAAIQAIAAYLDAFQKIADAATNSRGASKEIGTALTRVCLRHKAVESRLKTFTTAIMDCLVQPLQDKLEDWKRSVITIDKEHAKEYKRCRTELKKRSSDTLRLQKKARKGQSDSIQSLMDSHMQDVTLRRAELEEVEKKSLRSAMIEERLRYCTFVDMLQPVVKEECEVMSELGHLQEAMDSIAIVTKDPSVLPQASEELIHDTKATMTLYPESPGAGSGSQGGCSNSLGSRKSSVCSISSMNSSGSSNSPGHHHYPRSLSQLISPAIRLKPGESSDSGFCSSPALTTQASTANSQSHAVSTWPPHSQDAVPVLPPAADRPHTISTAYEKGHQRPPLTVYTFQNPETILEGSGGSGSIPGTPNGTSGGAGSGANTPSTQKSPAGALSRPPLPVRCSSLERPLSANNNRSTNNLLQRQCPSPIPAHITKELSAHHAQQQHMQQQQQQNQVQHQLQTSSQPPTYVNMSELANMAALKVTNQPQQQRPVAALQQQHSIDSISSQFSNDSNASGQHQSPQQQSVIVSNKTRSHSVSSSSASSNTPSLHSHPSIESGTVATPLVGQTPTPSSGSSTPQNHYSPLLTNSPSSTAAGTPSGGSVTSGMLSGFVYNVNSPTPPQSGTASIDSDVLKITEADGGQPPHQPTNESNSQQQQQPNNTITTSISNATTTNSQKTPTEMPEQEHSNATNLTSTVIDTESPTIVENDERSRASVLQKASMFEKQAAAAAASTAAVSTGRSNTDSIPGIRRAPEDVYRATNTGNHYQQPLQQQQHQHQQQHSEQQDVGGVTRIARRSSVNTAKPPPPVRRSSSVTPSHEATGTGAVQSPQQHPSQYQHPQHHATQQAYQQPPTAPNNSQYDSVDCLPPPPAYLLDTRPTQSTPTPPPPSAISATTAKVATMPNSSMKVAETVKALSAMRHKPASPNAIRHMQQQHQHQQQQQQLQHQHQQLLSPLQSLQPKKSQQLQPTREAQLQDSGYGGSNALMRGTSIKTSSQPVSPSYTSPPPYDFHHSKIELPPPLPPPNPNQQRSLKQQQQHQQQQKHIADHQHTTLADNSQQCNHHQQQKRQQHEQLYDYLPPHQHLHSPKQQHKQYPQQQQQHIEAIVDHEDEAPVYSGDKATFRTSSLGIYAQPKIVTSMSSFRSASPAPNEHHNQHHHVIPPTQPKTNPNLIAQLNARLNKQNQLQQQQYNASDGTYGSTPNSPNHHNLPHQHQHHQSEPVYMRNYTHPLHQQQQMSATSTNVATHQQQNYDGKSNIEKHNKIYGSFSTANATQPSQALASASSVTVSVCSTSSSSSPSSHFSHLSSNTANFNASPHFPLSSSTSSLLSKVTSFATNATSTVVALSSPTPSQSQSQSQSQATASGAHCHTSSRDHHIQHNQYQSVASQNAAQAPKNHIHSNIYSPSSSSSTTIATSNSPSATQINANKNATAAQQPKHQQTYAPSGGGARHYIASTQSQQQQQQQQQQHHHHHREPHHSCPPPLENPPPPPNNSSIYAASPTATMPKNATRLSSSASLGGGSGTYAPPSSTMTLPKNLAQQRLQQQQHYQQQQQLYQQQQYHHPTATAANVATQQHHHQQQQHSQASTANQRSQMPLPHHQQQQQQPQQMSYKQKSATLQSNHRQPPVPSRHSSVQQKIFVATNPFIQTTTIHCHSPASVHSQPASPTCSSPSSLASIYGTSSRSHHHHQQQQHQHHGSGGGAAGNGGNGYYAAPHNSTSYASSNIEKAGSIRSKTKAEFLENLNAKLAKQGLSGRAFAVRNLINSKALPDPRICHESLMDQIKRGATLKRNQKINDRSAPKIH